MLFIRCLLVALEKLLRYLFVSLRFAMGTKPIDDDLLKYSRKLCFGLNKNLTMLRHRDVSMLLHRYKQGSTQRDVDTPANKD